MLLTLRQAAEAVGMTKPALLKAIQRGSMSATRDLNGQWQIDPAELFRVYKPAPEKEPETLTVGTGQEAQQSDRLTAELKAVAQENALLREFHERERRRLESTIDDLKTDRDHWRQQATALLTHQPEPKEAPTRKEGRGWLWLGLLLIVIASSGAALFGYWLTLQQGGSL